ncbi:MAG: hypothetical protein ISS49_06235 [Anaerolineae bacterium]|nr:hypothetical protein [Anaerolineae bacterium]
MKTRLMYALILVLVLCASTASTVLAGDAPVVFYDDTEAVRVFPHDAAKGPSYVRNGAFDDWAEADGMPIGWKQYVYNPAGNIHWAKMDYADPRAATPNFALGLFTQCNSATAPGYGITYSPLSVTAAGYYWAMVHVTAWGEYDKNILHNSEAWYAIAQTDDPALVPASAWRELYPDAAVCPNTWGACIHLARKEVVWVEPGSSIFLKGEMKFPDYYAWTVFGWDDVALIDLVGTVYVEPTAWIGDGVVFWDPRAPR